MDKECRKCQHWVAQYKTLDDVVKGMCNAQTVTKLEPVYKSEKHWCSKYKKAPERQGV